MAMLAKITLHLRLSPAITLIVFYFVCFSAHPLSSQTSEASGVSPEITRVAGTEVSANIEYVRLLLNGKILQPADKAVPVPPPQLTAQCTRTASGKFAFELFANFGGITDTTFYPPWRPVSNSDLFPPRLDKFKVTMEFLGYTRVKPIKRSFEAVLQPVGQYRYDTPSGGSSNMEDITYYLRFLVALPTLRLTLPPNSVEFLTTPLLDQIRKEPLCKASLL